MASTPTPPSPGVGTARSSAAGRPDDEQARDAERLEEAARRWERRTDERERKQDALRSGDYVEADTPERLARWVVRHEKWFDALRPGRAAPAQAAPAAAADAADPPAPAPDVVDRHRPLRREDVSNELVERIVGRTRDLLSVEFFEMGLLAARCVGLVTTRGQANGTGFLVAPGLMITNEHVLRTAQEAADSDLELDFEDNRVGEAKRTEVFRLLPDAFFHADRALDFALVAVDLRSRSGTRLDTFNVLPLIGEEGKVRIGEAVNVVQHPGGRAKQVAIRNNRLVDLPEGPGMDAYFHYEADTEKGSSGAPVFNDFWEVVALHHSGVPRTDDQGRLVDASGTVIGADGAGGYVWVANEGIRVSRIVAAVEAAELPEHMHSVRETALRTWDVRGEPAAAVEVPLSPLAGPASTTSQEGVAARGAGADAPAATTIEVERGASVVEVTVPVRLRISVRAEPVADD